MEMDLIESHTRPADEIEDEDGIDDIAHRLSSPLTASKALRPPRENREAFLVYPESLPYKCESLAEMDVRLDGIMRRIVDCVRTKDYDVSGSNAYLGSRSPWY
jgi:proteasome activator subunit 4